MHVEQSHARDVLHATPNVACVVKIGGAAITQKNRLETLDGRVLATTAAHLAELGAAGLAAVIVHGAGSFGHHQASAAGVQKGCIQHSAAVRHGFAVTRASVTKLNNIVVQALITEGVSAIGLSPCGVWTTANRQVVVDGCGAVRSALEAGLVPVLHGDAVFDTTMGCTILGGDSLVARLCREFRPQRALFLTNVAGIYTRPPGHPQAELLSRIEVHPSGSWVGTVAGSGRVVRQGDIETSASGHDTTGGIEAKIREAAGIVAGGGSEVRIAEAGTTAALQACLLGQLPEDWVGTVVVAAVSELVG